MDPLVVPLRALDRSSIAVAGGKAANLGELLRAGFTVPDGFCVSTAAYRHFETKARLRKRIADHLAGLDPENPERLAAVGAAVRKLFTGAKMPVEIADAVRDAARPLAGQPLAVRSSATAEDLPEASFAGQQDTYLNVVGEDALLDAVRRCWASLWTDRAIAYRQRNAIPNESVALAVVVQVMVPAEVAGVLFTANPVSGKRTEAVIDASLGLGEAVVSGAVTPDNFVVDKRNGEVISRTIGSKRVQVVPVEAGGTAKVDVAPGDAAKQALADDIIVALTNAGSAIEAHFGWPQDVEWAVAGGQLYILQSRPITSLHPLPPAPKDGRFHAYISLSSMQGMIEPLTPMGASIFTEMSCYAFVGGDKQRAFLHEVAGRLYADATPVLRGPLGPYFPRLVLPEIEPVVGRIVGRLLAEGRFQQPPALRPRHVFNFVRRFRRTVPHIFLRVVRNLLSPEGARRRLRTDLLPRLAETRAWLMQPHHLGEQGDVLRSVFDVAIKRQIFFRLVTLVIAGVASIKQAENLARREGLDERDLTRVRRGLPHNPTTIMDLQLWDLAKQVKSDPAASAALSEGTAADLAALYLAGALPPTLQSGMAAFLKHFGHRAVREIDLGIPRWMEDPTYLFGILHNYMEMNDPDTAPDVHFARQKADADQAVDDLVEEMHRRPNGERKAKVLGFLLGRYRGLGGLREAPKFYIMWLFRGIREMVLDAGRQLAAQGRLDRPEDVFFLRLPELEKAASETTAYQGLIATRRRKYQREMARTRIPRVLTSEGEVLYGEAQTSSEGALVGTSASPGIARGRARVIRDPVGARLEAGDILVAPSTDPAWTPLFLTAGGLVMEAGGMMSHGSIVAREYGIPAVVGVAEATERLKDGEVVEVDGHQGTVKVVS